MNMFCFLSSFLLTTVLYAEEETVTTETESKSSKVIVINEGAGRKKEKPKVIVESGTDSIQGEPQEQMKAAYRTWENACKEWKAELKGLNGSNLLFMSCGAPKRETETIHSQKWFVYKSDAKFKIKVVAK